MRSWGQKTSQYHCHYIQIISRYWYWYQVTCDIVITTSLIYQWYHDVIIDIKSPKIHNITDITYQWYPDIDIDINSPAILSLVRKRVNGKRKSLLCLPAVKSRKFNPKLLKCFFSSKFKKEKVYTRPNGSKTKNRITEMVFYIFPMNWRKKFALRGSSLVST